MKQKTLYLLFLFLCGMAFTACEETTEPTAYDNWRERNDAFIDSIRTETGENYLDLGQTDMVLGDLYAVEVQDGNTTAGLQYAYCKKLVDNPDGERLLYTDNVEMYYRGTLINGEEFDGNFEGYGATDQQIPLDPAQMKWPTAFDEPTVMNVSNNMLNGVEWVLQHARTGERWIIYVPYYDGVGYGESDYNSIRGCSVLTFDYIIGDIVEDAD